MELEITDIEDNHGFDKRQGEIRDLTRIALTDSVENQRLRAIRRLEEIFRGEGFKLISGFQGDNQLMIRYQNMILNRGVYSVMERPKKVIKTPQGYEEKPVPIHPFIILGRGRIHTNYKRCEFDELE